MINRYINVKDTARNVSAANKILISFPPSNCITHKTISSEPAGRKRKGTIILVINLYAHIIVFVTVKNVRLKNQNLRLKHVFVQYNRTS